MMLYRHCLFAGPYQGQYQHQQPFIGPEQQPYGPHAAAGQYPAQNQYGTQNRQMYPPYGGPDDA